MLYPGRVGSHESMCPDSQAALERMCGFLTHLQCGVSNIWAVGQLESELAFSPAQAVMDDEIISYAKRYLRGVEVTEETLAVEVTRQVGISGSFLEHMHTAENFRKELFMPKILFRQTREKWEELGSKSLRQVAEEKAELLMRNPVETGLTDDQLKELDTMANQFLKNILAEN